MQVNGYGPYLQHVVLNTMKMKQYLISFILNFCIIGYVMGQDKYEKAFNRFYDTIAPKLQNKLNDNPIARLVPDFLMGRGGAIISVENDTLGKISLIVHYYTFKRTSFRKHIPEINESSTNITPVFSNLIREFFVFAINQIENQKNPPFGLDGVTYYFRAINSSENSIGASIWSPRKGSNLEKIIKVCYDLIPIAKGHQRDIDKVTKKMNKLLAELSE